MRKEVKRDRLLVTLILQQSIDLLIVGAKEECSDYFTDLLDPLCRFTEIISS